mmetsp:Transcript_3491/g.4105  ORF Transcript_3491/g.4105 Transcript_3491/m.4105 type:complete len:334 (+) Transcript_3491:67-1068(+)
MAEALPAGWTEHSDPGSGKNFFYNAGTGETSWERPKAAAGAPSALPEGWTEHSDPGSGRVFYYKAATGETSWEKPQSTEKKDDSAEKVPADATYSTAQARALGKEPRFDILKDRVLVLDKETWKSVAKTVFALNSGSLPASTGLVALYSVSQDEYWMLWRSDKTTEADKVLEDLENPDAGSLPEGWAEHQDPGTGRTFYYKAATGETSWEKPQAEAKAAGALPEGWTEHVDPGSGKTFYYKAATGETAWERPSAPGAAKGGLAEGWAEHVDPASNRTFYYKAATGETSWEKPWVEDAKPLDMNVSAARSGVQIESEADRASRRSQLIKKSAWT